MMLSRDLVLSVLEGGNADRTPVLPPFFGYYSCRVENISTAEAIEKPHLAARAQMKVAEQCGFDGVEIIFDFLSPAEACGSKVRVPEYGLIPVVRPVIAGLDDLDRMEVPDPREDRRFMSSLTMAADIEMQMSKSHFLYPTICGPFTLLGELRGLEKLFFDLIVEPGVVREMLRFSHEVMAGYQEEVLAFGPDAIAVVEPTASGDFLSEELFRKFALPAMTSYVNQIKKKGHRIMVHICGDSFGNMSEMSELDIDMLSVDSPVDMSEIHELFPCTAIVGNLPPEGALTGGPPYEVGKQALECMREMKGRKYILAAGCGLTMDCAIENVKMMRYASERSSLLVR